MLIVCSQVRRWIECIPFHSIQFNSIPLFYSILFYSILFYSTILRCLYSILFYSIPFYSILPYSDVSVLFYSIILFYSILFYSTILRCFFPFAIWKASIWNTFKSSSSYLYHGFYFHWTFILTNAQWRHNGPDDVWKSPALRLFTPPFIQAQIKENIKAPRHWPLCGEFTGDRWIPRTKGQYRGKCFHLMTSSCWKISEYIFMVHVAFGLHGCTRWRYLS